MRSIVHIKILIIAALTKSFQLPLPNHMLVLKMTDENLWAILGTVIRFVLEGTDKPDLSLRCEELLEINRLLAKKMSSCWAQMLFRHFSLLLSILPYLNPLLSLSALPSLFPSILPPSIPAVLALIPPCSPQSLPLLSLCFLLHVLPLSPLPSSVLPSCHSHLT